MILLRNLPRKARMKPRVSQALFRRDPWKACNSYELTMFVQLMHSERLRERRERNLLASAECIVRIHNKNRVFID